MKQRSNIFVQVIFCEFLGSVPEKQNIHVHFQLFIIKICFQLIFENIAKYICIYMA